LLYIPSKFDDGVNIRYKFIHRIKLTINAIILTMKELYFLSPLRLMLVNSRQM
jgi:hypothetical protein